MGDAHEHFPQSFEVLQTTPPAERRRLVAKGNFLAEHCLADGHTDCVLGFVDHCLGKSPPQLDVVADLWKDLRRAYAQWLHDASCCDERHGVLLRELLTEVASRLARVRLCGHEP
jgi:hypothetical protein